MIQLLLVLLLGGLAFGETETDPSFLKPDRIQYINQGLESLLETPKDRLENTYKFLRSLRSNLCISVSKQLEVQCLIEKAKKNCGVYGQEKREQCKAYSDVLLAVILEEPRIVSRSQKAKLAKDKDRSLGEAIIEEVRRHYAVLSLDLLASEHWRCSPTDVPCSSQAIHNYCEKYALDRRGSWQGCASGLIYFIGSSQVRGKNG